MNQMVAGVASNRQSHRQWHDEVRKAEVEKEKGDIGPEVEKEKGDIGLQAGWKVAESERPGV